MAEIKLGKVTIEYLPGGPTLTASWTEGTAVQEKTSTMTVTLKQSDELQKFFNRIINGSSAAATIGMGEDGVAPVPAQVTITAGTGTRDDAARATLSPFPNPNNDPQSLTVNFYGRGTSLSLQHGSLNDWKDWFDDSDRNQTLISPVAFSKANYLNGLEYTEEWRSTWQRAIALAWSDWTDSPDPNDPKNQPLTKPPSLKTQLLSNPFHFFKKYCNYALPPTVNLLVVDAETVSLDPAATAPIGFSPGTFPAADNDGGDPNGPDSTPNGTSDAPNWQWNLPRSVLIMFLPPPPYKGKGKDRKPDPKSFAIALTAYDAVGKSYPFTVTS